MGRVEMVEGRSSSPISSTWHITAAFTHRRRRLLSSSSSIIYDLLSLFAIIRNRIDDDDMYVNMDLHIINVHLLWERRANTLELR